MYLLIPPAQNAGKNEDSDFNPHPRWDLTIVSFILPKMPEKSQAVPAKK